MKTINEILVVGYTHSQPVVLEMHREYIDLALDLLEQTADAVTRSRAAKRALAIADRLATAPRPPGGWRQVPAHGSERRGLCRKFRNLSVPVHAPGNCQIKHPNGGIQT